MSDVLRIGSLCSGYGGLELGVQAVFGGTTAWVSDVDKGACKILAHRFPGVPNIGDMTAVKWVPDCPIELGGCGKPAEVLADKTGWQCHRCQLLWPISLGKVYWPEIPEPVDVLTAGYPCQPFSSAGYRQGDQDERHLWPAVLEAIRSLRPRLAVLENVAGHRSMGFDRVLGDLAEVGFDAKWTSVLASDVGAPHGRERLFVAAHPEGFRGIEGHAPRYSEASGTSCDWLGNSPRDLSGALRRWGSLLGRPCPWPLRVGEFTGNAANPKFWEWLMGLPDGWVTDIPGLTHAEKIKALGNGVVPQQCAAALREMARWEVAA